jgi:hypothetical protein
MKHKQEAKKLLAGLNEQVAGMSKSDQKKVLEKLHVKLGKQVDKTNEPQPIGFRQAAR